MDLYEEIVTEEQQTRESTHLEVKPACSGLLLFIIIIFSSSAGSSHVINSSLPPALNLSFLVFVPS